VIDIRIPRTVPQIPARQAARFAPAASRQEAPAAMDGLFPIARQILAAETDRACAAILLRLADDTLVTKGQVLREACLAAGFGMGTQFLDIRLAALSAVRDREGRLPEQHVRAVENWRRGLVALAQGGAA